MEMTSGVAVTVSEPSQVSDARRRGAFIASAVGFDEVMVGRVALAVTEAATNLIKHGGGGQVFIGPAGTSQARGVQVIATDKGPGISSVAASLRDGHSTAGSPGTGLGAIQRASTTFDIYSMPGGGTVIAATIYPDGVRPPASAAGVSVPIAAEDSCGDGWAIWSAGQLTSVFLSDGLGHGTPAATATAEAIGAFLKHAESPAIDVIRAVHDALKSTRGAAVAVAALDDREGQLKYCGLGNISGTIVRPDGTAQHLVSHSGIAGHTMRRIQEFSYSWPSGSLLVLQSDGVATNWTLDRYPGLATHAPDVIAGALYRDFRRGRDDATVVVTRSEARA